MTKTDDSYGCAPVEQILDLYHSICKNYPPIDNFNICDERLLDERWQEYEHNPDMFKLLFEKMETANILKHILPDMHTPILSWCLLTEHMADILENRYDKDTLQDTDCYHGRPSSNDKLLHPILWIREKDQKKIYLTPPKGCAHIRILLSDETKIDITAKPCMRLSGTVRYYVKRSWHDCIMETFWYTNELEMRIKLDRMLAQLEHKGAAVINPTKLEA